MGNLLVIYVHVLSSVVLVGFALFGAILTLAGAGDGLVQRVYRAPWPPRGLPVPVRLPVFGLGWAAFLATAASGTLLFVNQGADLGAYALKLGLGGLVLLAHVALSLRPRGALLVVNFVLVLGVVAVSAMLAR